MWFIQRVCQSQEKAQGKSWLKHGMGADDAESMETYGYSYLGLPRLRTHTKPDIIKYLNKTHSANGP